VVLARDLVLQRRDAFEIRAGGDVAQGDPLRQLRRRRDGAHEPDHDRLLGLGDEARRS
jgi:hypothetical protein